MVYDYSEGRDGQHARDFIGDWRGKLTCNDYSGYRQSFANGVTKLGCMAHARRKFVDLHVASKSQIAEQTLADWPTLPIGTRVPVADLGRMTVPGFGPTTM